MKYGNWTTNDDIFIIKNGKKYLNCTCECGTVKEVYYNNLKKGTSNRCQSCAGKAHSLPLEFIERWKGNKIGELTGTMFSHIKSKAKERSLEFSLTKDFLSNIFEKQGRKCALSGLDITLSDKIKQNNPDFNYITASLDRINSLKGYTEDNIQWVHKDINKMKMQFDNDYFIQICKLIAENNK